MAQMVKPRPMVADVEVNKDEKAYTAWGKAHKRCQGCGDPCSSFVRTISTHHIIKSRRSHDPCNLLRLCARCHDLAELLQMRNESGVELPKLFIGVCLAIKRVREPEQWDPKRLAALFGRPLPDELPIPALLEREYRNNRPSPYRPAPDELVARWCIRCGSADCETAVDILCRGCVAKDAELTAGPRRRSEKKPAELGPSDLEHFKEPVRKAIKAIADRVASDPDTKVSKDKRCPTCVRKGNTNPRRDCDACRKRGAI